jgi:quercetin dioxygenase-like cupin family protein
MAESEPLKDASHLYEVERRVYYGERPGLRIGELQLSPTQKVPWHFHNNIDDTFYVIEGAVSLFLKDPVEAVRLEKSQSYRVIAKRPHLVANDGDTSATFLVIQGIGEYDYVPLV